MALPPRSCLLLLGLLCPLLFLLILAGAMGRAWLRAGGGLARAPHFPRGYLPALPAAAFREPSFSFLFGLFSSSSSSLSSDCSPLPSSSSSSLLLKLPLSSLTDSGSAAVSPPWLHSFLLCPHTHCCPPAASLHALHCVSEPSLHVPCHVPCHVPTMMARPLTCQLPKVFRTKGLQL